MIINTADATMQCWQKTKNRVEILEPKHFVKQKLKNILKKNKICLIGKRDEFPKLK